MKILFLTPWYPDEHNPNHGVFVRDQAVLINKQHEVRVVSAKIDYSNFALSSLTRKDTIFQGVSESLLVVRKSLPVFNQFNFFLRTCRETLTIAKEFRPDIIHGNIGYPGAFWSWMLSAFLGVPFLITEHTRITNNFRSPVHKQLTLFGLRRASAVIGVSRWHADEIAAFIAKKVVVIPNVIHFEKYPAVRVPPATDEFQIGFLGGLSTPVKGLDILLHAAATLQGKFRLHIGGDGALLNYYKELAKELRIDHCCFFYGSIPHAQVNSFMQQLHFFVSSSRSETFGISMVEALVCGLPVVATDSGGSREFITPQNGVLVATDALHLAEGIRSVMNRFETYDPTVIRNSVLDKFSDNRFLDEINKVYGRLIQPND